MRALRVIGVLLVIAVVFLYRFNTLGGSLGGFDDDHFINLVRANQLLDGDWPLRDYPDGSLQGAWPPVTYLASAAAQRVLGRSLLAEAVLTTGAIAVAAGITAVAGANLTALGSLGVVAAVLSVIPSIKLYGYARPLLFSVVLLLVFRYIDRHAIGRLAAVSVALSVAFLTRHDYAIYLGLSVAVAIAAAHRADPRLALRRVALCAGVSLVLLLPTLVMVQRVVGVTNYIAAARAVMLDEQTRTNLRWPGFDFAAGWSNDNHVAVLYYLFLVLPAIAALVAAARVRNGRASAGELPKVLTLCAAGALTNHFLLRGNLEARLPDAVLFHALTGVWLLKVAWQAGAPQARVPVPRLATAGIASVLVAVSAVSLGAVGSLPQELGTSRFKDGVSATFRTTARVWGILRDLPPARWDTLPDRGGEMLLAAYLNQCTPPDARILNATYPTDYLVFARRGFAAGHANFVPGLYNTPRDQATAIARARKQVVPVAITDPADAYQEDFAPDFPLVDRYLQERYVEAGTIDKDGEPFLRVLVERNRQPSGTFAQTGLPCFR
jgi:hypothetical protein